MYLCCLFVFNHQRSNGFDVHDCLFFYFMILIAQIQIFNITVNKNRHPSFTRYHYILAYYHTNYNITNLLTTWHKKAHILFLDV